MNQDSLAHKNHRKRLKQRFLEEGLENFKDHNILELLLFYSIPRKDTNLFAHKLLEHYGSLSSVFEADHDSLVKFGVTENTAILLNLIPKLARAYLLDKDTKYSKFSDEEKLGKYLVNYFIGEQKEKLIALFFTNSMELIKLCEISEGTVISTDVQIRKIAELGFSKNAAFVILAHNHPDGISAPSEEDIGLTRSCSEIFEKLGMPIIEHFVIGGMSYCTIISGRSN